MEAGQGISSRISLSPAIIDLEVIPGEFLGLTDLPGTQTLGIHESAEIVVVDEDKNLIFVAFQIVAPILEDLNNSQQLLVVGLVLSPRPYYLPREKGHRVPLTNIVGLRRIFI